MVAIVLGLLLAAPRASELFAELKWRDVGPWRGSRTKAAAGAPQSPGVFYIGAVNGGVWRTDDYGRTWTPIFDDQPTGSIGAIAVAPSNPDVIYLGSGDMLCKREMLTGTHVPHWVCRYQDDIDAERERLHSALSVPRFNPGKSAFGAPITGGAGPGHAMLP